MGKVDRKTAQAMLTDIEQQRTFIVGRLGGPPWLLPAAALAMGTSVTILFLEDLLVTGSATLTYVAGMVTLFGAPSRLGVVPRETGRSIAGIGLASVFLLAVFTLGLVGAESGALWLCFTAGPIAAVAALIVGYRRTASLRRRMNIDASGNTR